MMNPDPPPASVLMRTTADRALAVTSPTVLGF